VHIAVNDFYISTDAKLLKCIVTNWTVQCSTTSSEKIPTRLDISLSLSVSGIFTV